MAERAKVYNFASHLAHAGLANRYNVYVEGEENIPSEGRCIVAPNHVNLADPYILLGWIKRRQLTLLNRYDHKPSVPLELFEQVRMMGTHALGGVMIDRTADGAKVTKLSSILPKPPSRVEAFTRLKDELIQGGAVCIFPQGERDNQANLRPGITYLALDEEIGPTPIIPVKFKYHIQPTTSKIEALVNIEEAILAVGSAESSQDRSELLLHLSEDVLG